MYSSLGFMVNSDLSQRVWHVVIVKQTLSDIHQWLAIKVFFFLLVKFIYSVCNRLQNLSLIHPQQMAYMYRIAT